MPLFVSRSRIRFATLPRRAELVLVATGPARSSTRGDRVLLHCAKSASGRGLADTLRIPPWLLSLEIEPVLMLSFFVEDERLWSFIHGRHRREEVERGRVGVDLRRPVPADHDHGLGVRLGAHPLLGDLLRLERDDRIARRLGLREPAQVLRGHRADVLFLAAADEDRGAVLGHVVGLVVLLRVRIAVLVDVGHPADDGPLVGVAHPELGLERLHDRAERLGVVPHPPLLLDHLALRVELAEHGVEEPVGFQPHEELDLVRGQLDEVARPVVRRGRVQARAAVVLEEAREVLADRDLLRVDEGPRTAPEFHPRFLVVGADRLDALAGALEIGSPLAEGLQAAQLELRILDMTPDLGVELAVALGSFVPMMSVPLNIMCSKKWRAGDAGAAR